MGFWLKNLLCSQSVQIVMTMALLFHFTAQGAVIKLSDNWKMQSSAAVAKTGAEISVSAYQPAAWYPVTIPSTVLAGLVANNVYTDVYFSKNLGTVPAAAFSGSWWYRTTFTLPQRKAGDRVWLDFKGINHRANIWVNGQQVAASANVYGCFRTFEFDITDFCSAGTAENVLAVEVFKPAAGDLSIYYVDWAPAPPDQNMGIYRDVYVRTSGPVTIRNPQVISTFDLPSLATAHLTVVGEVTNPTSAPVQATINGVINAVTFSQTISVPANQTVEAVFSSQTFSQLNIANPKVWWPWHYGDQPLYDLTLSVETGGAPSDSVSTKFGIRQVESYKTAEGYTCYNVNGKRILIRGAGWCPDLLQRSTPESQEAHIRYVRDMNLNTIRQEGKFEDQHFYDLCDAYGIFVMAGWCCCDKWEQWGTWTQADIDNANESTRSKIRELRSHPSSLVWLTGSDNAPPAQIALQYSTILTQLRWPNPVLSNAAETNGSGVKMRGPYEWVPPNYWLTDVSNGGAFGFSTEIGPGPAVPPLASLQKMLPADHLWPIDDYWNYHCGGNVFANVTKFTTALNSRYGTAASAADYAKKAQAAAYESHRAMFEGYGRNKYHATGVIQWMLNNAWPSMIWHLYDYYLRPGGSYFGAKIACEPLHIQYSYDNKSIAVVNSFTQAFSGLTAVADVYNLDGTVKYHNQAPVSVQADSVVTAFILPAITGLSTTYFLHLVLKNQNDSMVSVNSYWLSTTADVINFGAADWYYTPVSSYADLTGLQGLATVTLQSASTMTEIPGNEEMVTVSVKNNSTGVVFGVHLAVNKGVGGEEVLPVLWSDNYFLLVPGEERVLNARYKKSDMGTALPSVTVDGWNVTVTDIPLGAKGASPALARPVVTGAYSVTIIDCRGRTVAVLNGKTGGATFGRLAANALAHPGNHRLPAGIYVARITCSTACGSRTECRRILHKGF
jgi:exo-1,4-beta-D-glucosaminidase